VYWLRSSSTIEAKVFGRLAIDSIEQERPPVSFASWEKAAVFGLARPG
jgi:hypothetical protein